MRKKKVLASAFALMLSAVMFSNCSDEDDTAAVTNVIHSLQLDLPLDMSDAKLDTATAVMTNVTTGMRYVVGIGSSLKSDNVLIPEGIYNIAVSGTIVYVIEGESTTANVKASQENVSVSASKSISNIALNLFNSKAGLLITEIFFAGTTTPEGKQYSDDQYFKIGNNSDTIMYLDGLAIVESEFMTTSKQDYTPNIMEKAMTVDAIYVFPGNGKQYPIKPGQEVVVALNGKNHLEFNANSIDLSKADFEFYDESENPNFQDEDNAKVTNLENWYDYSMSYFTLHNRGFHSYALAKPEVSKDEFINNYKYKYTYVFTFNEYSFDKDGEAYKVPNAWIVDAVNLSVEEGFEWLVTSATLDAGWAHCGTTTSDKTRYGKAVVRKKNGNKWVDTNNSSKDFESEAKPTLMK
ncbi:MAG: DUF4876 domain-containing protein [Paludibacteraceae bacterium]|nr:DUF4876 domain-containing protein [Paludibacteraceae bacterium]